MSIKLKAKKCKGTGKAIGWGCDNVFFNRKFGLCGYCYPNWLYSSDEGRKLLDKKIDSAVKKVKAKKKSDQRKKDKKKLEEMKTFSDWVNDLQKIFNKFIRLRDADLPCISCGTIANVKYDAGHYLSVGSYPNLRVNEMNVNKQCSKFCNVEKRGNVVEYRDGLIRKYGLDKVNELEAKRQSTWKKPIYEIKEMITYYKGKVREMEKNY